MTEQAPRRFEIFGIKIPLEYFSSIDYIVAAEIYVHETRAMNNHGLKHSNKNITAETKECYEFLNNQHDVAALINNSGGIYRIYDFMLWGVNPKNGIQLGGCARNGEKLHDNIKIRHENEDFYLEYTSARITSWLDHPQQCIMKLHGYI